MTTSSYDKVLKQIAHKKGKYQKFLKHNTPKPRKYGQTTKKCERCGRTGAHISRYGLHYCRHCFREIAEELGFKKYN